MTRRTRRALWLVPLLLLLCIGAVAVLVAVENDGEDALPHTVVSSADAGSAASAEAPRVREPGETGRVRTGGQRDTAPAPPPVALPPEPADIRSLRRRLPLDPLGTPWNDPGSTKSGIGGGVSGTFATPPTSARVVDAETGEPVVGAQVIGVLVGRGGKPVRRGGGGTTDERGTFRMRPLDSTDNVRFEVRVRHMRYAARDVKDWGGDDIRLTALARATGALVGSLRAEHGETVQGVIVVHMREPPAPKEDVFAWADGDGVFRIEGLPPGVFEVWSGSGAASRVRIVAGGVAQAEVATTLRTAVPTDDRVNVVVRVEHPLVRSGDAIRAHMGDALHWSAAVESGEARFRLPAGDWRIHVPLSDGTSLSREIELPRGSGVQTVTLGE